MESPPPAPPLSDDDARLLREFLSSRDLLCPRCAYNLRGLEKPRCPECGLDIRLPTGDPSCGLSEAERMARWLRSHDLICKKCKTNLRGGASNVCPTCGATYMLQHTSEYVDSSRIKRRRQATWSGFLIVMIPLCLLLAVIVGPVIFLWIIRVLRW